MIARPVAVMELENQGTHEPKVLCVPCEDPNWQQISDLKDLPEQLVEEIAHFFIAYKKRANHDVRVTGWRSRDAAGSVMEEGYERLRPARRSSGDA